MAAYIKMVALETAASAAVGAEAIGMLEIVLVVEEQELEERDTLGVEMVKRPMVAMVVQEESILAEAAEEQMAVAAAAALAALVS